MMERGERIRLLIGVGLIIAYLFFSRTLPFAFESLWVVLISWAIIAAFIAPPLATLFSERLLEHLLRRHAGKIAREYSVARSFAAQGEFEEAIQEYRRGLEKDPENVMLRLEIAEILCRDMKEYRRAISELEECLKVRLGETQGASVLNRIADIYEINLGDEEAALATLRKIAQNWPGTKVAQRARQRIESMQYPNETAG